MNLLKVKGDITLQTIDNKGEEGGKCQEERRIHFAIDLDSPLIEEFKKLVESRRGFW